MSKSITNELSFSFDSLESFLVDYLEKANDKHIITNIKRDSSGAIFKVKTAAPTFYNRFVAYLSGTNKNVADTIKSDLEAKYGKDVSNFAFPKKKYGNASFRGLNVRNIKDIHHAAEMYKLRRKSSWGNQQAISKLMEYRKETTQAENENKRSLLAEAMKVQEMAHKTYRVAETSAAKDEDYDACMELLVSAESFEKAAADYRKAAFSKNHDEVKKLIEAAKSQEKIDNLTCSKRIKDLLKDLKEGRI